MVSGTSGIYRWPNEYASAIVYPPRESRRGTICLGSLKEFHAGTDIDAGGLSRVFAATSSAGNVEFDNLTISGGKTTADFESGAGIQYKSTGTLTLLNSAVSGNSTAGFHSYGAGIFTGSGVVTMT